jgi:hypothetical protein
MAMGSIERLDEAGADEIIAAKKKAGTTLRLVGTSVGRYGENSLIRQWAVECSSPLDKFFDHCLVDNTETVTHFVDNGKGEMTRVPNQPNMPSKVDLEAAIDAIYKWLEQHKERNLSPSNTQNMSFSISKNNTTS